MFTVTQFWFLLFFLHLIFQVSQTLSLFLLIYLSLILGARLRNSFFSSNDFSYGVYIYAGPLTHLVASAFDNFFVVVFLSVSSTVCFGAVSWYLIEKPTLRYSKGISK